MKRLQITTFLIIAFIYFSNAQVTVYPYSQAFGSSVPSGWASESSASATNWNFSSYSTNAGGSANYETKLSALATNDDYILSESFTLTAGKLYQVTFRHKRTATLNIYVGTVQSAAGMLAGTNILSSTADPSTGVQASSNYYYCTSTGTYYFGFRVQGNASNAHIDDIQIDESDPPTITWDGSTDGDWNTAANWDLNRVPTSADIIIIPSTGVGTYPSTIPSGNYQELNIHNGSAGTLTFGDGSSINIGAGLTITSSGNPVTINNDITAQGNVLIGTSQNAFTFNMNANITCVGNFTLGESSIASTFNIGGQINATGNFTIANNSSQITNITYTNNSAPSIIAANSASLVFYGTVNYTSAKSQFIMKGQYIGDINVNGIGYRYIDGDLNLDNNLNITGGTVFASDLSNTSIGTGSTGDLDTSPFRGSNRSEKWQSIILTSDLTDLSSGDFIKSIAFYVSSHSSSSAF